MIAREKPAPNGAPSTGNHTFPAEPDIRGRSHWASNRESHGAVGLSTWAEPLLMAPAAAGGQIPACQAGEARPTGNAKPQGIRGSGAEFMRQAL